MTLVTNLCLPCLSVSVFLITNGKFTDSVQRVPFDVLHQ